MFETAQKALNIDAVFHLIDIFNRGNLSGNRVGRESGEGDLPRSSKLYKLCPLIKA